MLKMDTDSDRAFETYSTPFDLSGFERIFRKLADAERNRERCTPIVRERHKAETVTTGGLFPGRKVRRA